MKRGFSGMSRFSRALAAALLAPLLVAGVGVFAAAGVPPFGGFWPDADTNIAEAAALRDGARVRALVQEGASVNDRRPIREGLLDGDDPATTMTPLEAARAGGSEEMVGILMELGASDPGAPPAP
jgi:hypothetical protein